MRGRRFNILDVIGIGVILFIGAMVVFSR